MLIYFIFDYRITVERWPSLGLIEPLLVDIILAYSL